MSDLQGMEELLQDFLMEATELLSSVDNKLVDLEKMPNDNGLLNDIFRGFHTIKGGAGFLNATELVTLCHLTENLFDRLRNGQLALTGEIMDLIMDATGAVRQMFHTLGRDVMPGTAAPELLASLKQAIAGELVKKIHAAAAAASLTLANEPDWGLLLRSLAENTSAAPLKESRTPEAAQAATIPIAIQAPEEIIQRAVGRRPSDKPGYQGPPTSRREGKNTRDNTIRVDTSRLDQVLNLSGEIGLTKNCLKALRNGILNGNIGTDTVAALDQAVGQLDLVVSDLQSAVMKTRMQPIGRLFQKYPRIARDLARGLCKDVELVLVGEETEIDKTMIEDLSNPIIHLIRNAVDHGIEPSADRSAGGKPARSEVRLEASQQGDHIVIVVSDDGRGMNPEKLKAKALEKGLITDEEANAMDEGQSFNLLFLPGFSTVEVASDLSGRGVDMDAVKTSIRKLSGSIDINHVQEVGGNAMMIVRGEVLPLLPLASLLGWSTERVPEYGVLMQVGESAFILAIDGFAGREDAVIKSLEGFRPKGVSGVTTMSNGQIVLILDMQELLSGIGENRGVPRSSFITEAVAA